MSNASRDQERIIQAVKKLGWRVDETRRHWVIYPPVPHPMITISRTPSDPGRAFKNARGDVNRILRALGKPEIFK